MADEKQTAQPKEAEGREATDKQTADAVKTFYQTGKPPQGFSIRFEQRNGESVPVVAKL